MNDPERALKSSVLESSASAVGRVGSDHEHLESTTPFGSRVRSDEFDPARFRPLATPTNQH